MENSGYSFKNFSNYSIPNYTGYYGYYEIYFLGNLIVGTDLQYNIGRTITDLFFISYSTGFFLQTTAWFSNPYGPPWPKYYLNRTQNYGLSWDQLRKSPDTPNIYYAPRYNGSYVLSDRDAIMMTYFENAGYEYLYLNNSIIDSIFEDKIIHYDATGVPLCDLDTLTFYLHRNEGTVTYNIVINFEYEIPETQLFITKNYGVDDYLFINEEIEFDEDFVEVSIFDVSGAIVKNFSLGYYRKLYVGDLRSGMYIFKVTTKNKVVTEKFIKN